MRAMSATKPNLEKRAFRPVTASWNPRGHAHIVFRMTWILNCSGVYKDWDYISTMYVSRSWASTAKFKFMNEVRKFARLFNFAYNISHIGILTFHVVFMALPQPIVGSTTQQLKWITPMINGQPQFKPSIELATYKDFILECHRSSKSAIEIRDKLVKELQLTWEPT